MSRVALQSEAYRILGHGADGPGNQISGLPVHVSFTKSLFARWSGSWDASDISSLQSGLNGMLQGQISNPIDIELTRCIVAYENWAYRIPGRFVKGDPPTYFSDLKPLDFRWQLTRRRIVDGHDVTTPWSVTDFEDLPRIVEMMMFFEAAGGTAYTRLENDYQNFLDLSPHLRAGRAVLIGQGRAAATLNVEGADTAIETDKQLTLYRIVFPVLPKKGSDS